MAVSKRLRFEILRRDNHTCRYCGRSSPDVVLNIDHVVPTTLGGTDDPANLVAACFDCNSGKSHVPAGAPLVADVAQDALRWAAAMKQATADAQLDRDVRYAIAEEFSTFWEAVAPTWARLPEDWETSIGKFTTLGLTRADILEAANTAATNRRVANGAKWRYFCGICWGYLRDRQVAALAIAQAGELQPEPGPSTRWTGEFRAALINYCHLSEVCDGRVMAEMGL